MVIWLWPWPYEMVVWSRSADGGLGWSRSGDGGGSGPGLTVATVDEVRQLWSGVYRVWDWSKVDGDGDKTGKESEIGFVKMISERDLNENKRDRIILQILIG